MTKAMKKYHAVRVGCSPGERTEVEQQVHRFQGAEHGSFRLNKATKKYLKTKKKSKDHNQVQNFTTDQEMQVQNQSNGSSEDENPMERSTSNQLL